MRNLVLNIYCTRDRHTKTCPLHDAYIDRLAHDSVVQACIDCPMCEIEFTYAGKSLMLKGLPRNLNGMNLENFEE